MDAQKGDQLAQPLVDLYNQLEAEMLANMASLLANKTSLERDDPEVWKLKQLEMLGMLNKKNLKVIRDAMGVTSKELNKLLIGAELEGLPENETILQKAIQKGAQLLKVVPFTQSPIINQILLSYQAQAKDVLNLVNTTLLSQSKQAYIDLLNQAALQMAAGYKSREQVLRDVIVKWADKGIPALIDKGGHRWTPETYVRTVLKSTMGNMVGAMQDERLKEYGCDYIEVSSHVGNRPGCQPYAGRVFSLKEGDPTYPYLYDPSVGRIGAPDSLFGVNCGHKKYPFFPGISVQRYHPNSKAEDDKHYKESQEQRKLEVKVRKAKRKEQMLKAVGDQDGAKLAHAKVVQAQKDVQSFVDQTGRTRRRYREAIVTPKEGKGPNKGTGSKKIPPNPTVQASKGVTIPIQSNVQAKGSGASPKGPSQPKHKAKVQPKSPTKKPIKKPDVSQIKVGDRIQFFSEGQKIMATVQKIYTSSANKGKLGVQTEFGTLKMVQGDRILQHIPVKQAKIKKVPQLKRETYQVIDSLSEDVVRDKKRLASMGQTEKEMVHTYTTSYYHTMNSYLRKGKKGNPDLEKENKLLHETLLANAHPMKEKVQLFRMIDSNSLPFMFDKETCQALKDAIYEDVNAVQKAKSLVVGGAFQDKGFVSSTYKEGAFGEGKDVKLNIYVPKGYKGGLFVESVSEYPEEKEYIFHSGMKFDIRDVTFDMGKISFDVVPAN